MCNEESYEKRTITIDSDDTKFLEQLDNKYNSGPVEFGYSRRD